MFLFFSKGVYEVLEIQGGGQVVRENGMFHRLGTLAPSDIMEVYGISDQGWTWRNPSIGKNQAGAPAVMILEVGGKNKYARGSG